MEVIESGYRSPEQPDLPHEEDVPLQTLDELGWIAIRVMLGCEDTPA